MANHVGQAGGNQSTAMKVVWTRRAIRQLAALRNYIAKESEQNATRVAQRILGAVELLRQQPEIGRPGRIPGTRELVVQDTRFLIPYRVKKGRLELIAVFEGHQKWSAKL